MAGPAWEEIRSRWACGYENDDNDAQPRARLFALLAHDTGSNSLDNVTSDSTIMGMALRFPLKTNYVREVTQKTQGKIGRLRPAELHE